MFHYSNVRRTPSLTFPPHQRYDYHCYDNSILVGNPENELLLTSAFDPMISFDPQQQQQQNQEQSYQRTALGTITPQTVLPGHDVASAYYAWMWDCSNTPGLHSIKNDNADQQQHVVDHGTFLEYDSSSTLIDMLLTAAASNGDDPLLSCMPSDEPSPPSSTSTEDHHLNHYQQSPAAITDASTEKKAGNAVSKQRQQSTKKRRSTSNARMGYCQHPKHLNYREENNSAVTCTKAALTPRRGRPPKGTKAIDKKAVKEGYVWAMTVRPLPKRLEAVVGYANIKVCLTCLKRSDTDLEYLAHPAYVGPQQQQQHNNSSK
ncbi:hypothetical protein BDB00DRAFT_818149 [Zychaea mexicana]|uniref:uncharacterized protein n=1 Tax=Zychaea mexicana TaxID=64656 RepID=UPI0022FF388F|nr:uncharacterized protein BDB00DRAFT_818149 [Zychaea mexicana]KAI9494464.1 hypothetical protein BDB00DRAFT_818149 [Zychaea mexicana]